MSEARSSNAVAAVIWDMDGTLVDSFTVACESFAEAIRLGGAGEPTRGQILAAFPIGPPAAILTSFLGRPATDADLDAYHRGIRARCHRVAVFEGIAETLAALQGRVRLGVFTGASSTAAATLLSGAGLAARLDRIVGMDGIPRPKPDPCGLLATMAGLDVAPAETVYVGDSPLDIACAQAAGVRSVGADWSGGYPADAPRPSLFLAASPREVVSYVGRMNGW